MKPAGTPSRIHPMDRPAASPQVALIQALYRSFDEPGFKTFRGLCAPDIEWVQNPGFPEGAVYRGVDAVIEGIFGKNGRRWEGFSVEVEEILDAGSSVVVLGRYLGRNRQTGRPLNAAVAHVYDISDGRVARFRMFADTKTIWDSLPAAQA